MNPLQKESLGRCGVIRGKAYRQACADLTNGKRRRGREALFHGNMRMAARSVLVDFAKSSIPEDDLLQEAYTGLWEATGKFDPGVGTRFTTYARWYIRMRIFHAFSHSSLVRLPQNRFSQLQAIHRVMNEHRNGTGEIASDAYVADKVGIAEETVRMLRATGAPPRPLDGPAFHTDGEQNTRLGDVLPSSTPDPDRQVMDREVAERVERMMSQLDTRTVSLLERYYGLNGRTPETYQEIGTSLDMSRERVRQIVTKGMNRLRYLCGQISKDQYNSAKAGKQHIR